ncbi:MAG: tRNA 2-thiouridine(34) synthase MnmA [Candidatus Auribacterota bacterium]|nr:tRNA 2-thiouridine(34) synthase MnmA [Candidatus Auribacterota bacterium]
MKIGVALSGGKDSSLVASLLVRDGHQVEGYHLLLCPDEYSSSPSKDQLISIRQLCDKLDIRLKVIDARKDFRREIMDSFVSSYQEGKTPNPCVLCNRLFKFGLLLDTALEDGCDLVAGGHYARVVREKDTLLKRPIDPGKDETYFLFELSPRQLDYLTFPLGEIMLDQLEELSGELLPGFESLPVSQEACFISRSGLKIFLREELIQPDSPGDIVDTAGQRLGEHPGYQYYTIGQRKGLSSASGKKGPLYVLRVIPERNEVVVGDKEDLFSSRLLAVRPNWLSISPPSGPIRVKAKIRYTHPEAEALVTPLEDNKVRVEFPTPQEAITPGQAVVFYRDDILLGGAWIEEVL